MGSLYLLIFGSGKLYVGITTQPVPRRYRQHLNSARAGSNLLVHRAVRKHGAPEVRVLMRDTIEVLGEYEKDLIEELSTLCPNGYNLDMGGQHRTPSVRERQEMSRRTKTQDTNYLLDPKIRARQGKSMRKVWGRPGYREAVAAKISEASKGRQFSEETRAKMSEAAKQRQARMTEEQRSNQREKGRQAAAKRWGKTHG